MSQSPPLEELKTRFSEDQLKRLKTELNLLFSNPPEDFPQITLEFHSDKKSGLFLQVIPNN